MTVESIYVPVSNRGNGVTVAFFFPYQFFEPSDLFVRLFDLSTNTPVVPQPGLNGASAFDYRVTGVIDDEGTGEYLNGTVTFNTAPPPNYQITIERSVAGLQSVSLADDSLFPAKSVEAELDRLQMQIQEGTTRSNRAIHAPASDGLVDLVLPPASERADTVLTFDGAGNVADPGIAVGPLEAAIAALLSGVSPAAAVTGWAKTLAAAMVLYAAPVVLADGQPVTVAGRAAVGDGYGGTFVYDATDAATLWLDNARGFVDAVGRRFKRLDTSLVFATWYQGVVGNGVADCTTGLNNFLSDIANFEQGFVPPAAVYYRTSGAGLSASRQISVKGVGLASRIHYDGAGLALVWLSPRFCGFQNLYFTWTDAAAGGLRIKGARENFYLRDVFAENPDGNPKLNAYGVCFSSSWGVEITGGRYRGASCIWLDAINDFDGQPAVNNAFTLKGVSMQLGNVGLNAQSGFVLNVMGSDIEGNDVAIKLGCDLVGGQHALQVFNIHGNYLEGNPVAIVVGDNNSSASSTGTGQIWGNRLDANTRLVNLVNCDNVTVGENEWGAGDYNIAPTATRIASNTIKGADDGGPSTSYVRNSAITIQRVELLQQLSFERTPVAPPLGASQNDYNPAGLSTANMIRLSSTVAVSLAGLVPGLGGGHNYELVLVNAGGFAITLLNNDPGSQPQNRFNFGANYVLQPGIPKKILYDTLTQRWLQYG